MNCCGGVTCATILKHNLSGIKNTHTQLGTIVVEWVNVSKYTCRAWIGRTLLTTPKQGPPVRRGNKNRGKDEKGK